MSAEKETKKRATKKDVVIAEVATERGVPDENPNPEKKERCTNFYSPSVMLVDSVFFDNEGQPRANFAGVPVSDHCPYIEMIFDPITKVLAIISKHKKPSFHFVDRVDNDGAPIRTKNKQIATLQPYQKQRIEIETYHEYYIRSFEEIENFLAMHVVNPGYDFKKYFK